MKVTMINSVGEYAAGTEVELDEELADDFILKGYAEGSLSRDYPGDERERRLATTQVVNA